MPKTLALTIAISSFALSACTSRAESLPAHIWLSFTEMRSKQAFCLWDLEVAFDGKKVNEHHLPGHKLCTFELPPKYFPTWPRFGRQGKSVFAPYWGYKTVELKFRREDEGPWITCTASLTQSLQLPPGEYLRGLSFISTEHSIEIDQWTAHKRAGGHSLDEINSHVRIATTCRP